MPLKIQLDVETLGYIIIVTHIKNVEFKFLNNCHRLWTQKIGLLISKMTTVVVKIS